MAGLLGTKDERAALALTDAASRIAGNGRNVPTGFVFGLPVGISFFGRAWSEPSLIKIAYAYEQLTKTRRPPAFLPTANLALER